MARSQPNTSTNPNSREAAADRELVITRVIDAPARLLFEAQSKPEHLLKWFGPAGYPLALCEVDFRVGGKFRMTMREEKSGELMQPFGGEYVEIVPHKKIVYTDAFDGEGSEQMVVTITYDEGDDGKTTLTIHTLFGSAEMKRTHVEMGYQAGVNSGLDQLQDLVKSLAAT